jgi:hypothetical protein
MGGVEEEEEVKEWVETLNAFARKEVVFIFTLQ